LGLGGMNHFMLPTTSDSNLNCNTTAMRYGSFAMEQLINEILKFGGHRDRLEVKLTGGGKILTNMNSQTDIGFMNIRFARQYLAQEGLPTLAEDLGGEQPRKVLYQPVTGRLRVKKLNSLRNDTLASREQIYRDKLQKQPMEGDIELF
ncbi:MAG: chemoreceptor glutamine deamidase CheD, partial [Motiliproteus sp.]|nr:chemoreceptor glutamine deamidase CheD [Motiliproteus sp.]